jgi:hypothetical protein
MVASLSGGKRERASAARSAVHFNAKGGSEIGVDTLANN